MTLELPGELTIHRAAELAALLLAALERGEPVELVARAVAEVDVAGLQLLCAARRSAVARNVALAIAPGTQSDALREAIALAGLGGAPEARWLVEEETHA